MSRVRLFLLRSLVLAIAVALPAELVMMAVGPPPEWTVAALERWAPVRDAGPSAQLLAGGMTRLVGPSRVEPPPWFTEADRELLDRAEAALHNNKLQEGLGHLMVLSSRLEDRGKTLKDFLPLVAPDIAKWLVASYFAPVLLGTLTLLVAGVIFLPWLMRRLVEALKVLIGVVVALGVAVLAGSLAVSLSGERALVFSLIEYLAAVTALMLAGNLLVFVAIRRARALERRKLERQRLDHPEASPGRVTGSRHPTVAAPSLPLLEAADARPALAGPDGSVRRLTHAAPPFRE